MQLLIVRHGAAGDKAEFAKTGKSDDLRPLTSQGKAAMARSAEGLREIVPEISEVASSPLVRARQTAEILASAYQMKVATTTDVLSPDTPFDEFAKWIAKRVDQDLVAVVGHEPHLSGLATWLMCGKDDSRIQLKKGGACLLTLPDPPKAGSAMLEWLMQPKHLRALAE